jgi:hypothetical protein
VRLRFDEAIIEPLMVAFVVVVVEERREHVTKLVRLRAICFIQAVSGLVVVPAK